MLMHVGTDISIVAVAQNRNVVEEDIRSLKTELVEPSVFRDDVFQLVIAFKVFKGVQNGDLADGSLGPAPLFVCSSPLS